MQNMDRMFNSFGMMSRDPFMALTDGREQQRQHQSRPHQSRHQMAPYGGDPFAGMFSHMNSMMSNMHNMVADMQRQMVNLNQDGFMYCLYHNLC